MGMMFRLQGWLADHVRWVQYPPERDARFSARARSAHASALPIGMRLGIGLVSLFWVLVLLAVLAVVLAAVWAFLGGLIGSP